MQCLLWGSFLGCLGGFLGAGDIARWLFRVSGSILGTSWGVCLVPSGGDGPGAAGGAGDRPHPARGDGGAAGT